MNESRPMTKCDFDYCDICPECLDGDPNNN